MIWILKGAAPSVLTGEGAKFQREAITFEAQFATVGSTLVKPKAKGMKATGVGQVGKQKKDKNDVDGTLASYAKLNANGGFGGFASKLFSVYSFYSNPEVKSQLILSHHGKCAFCESFILGTDVGDVEHYRPKAEVTECDPRNTVAEQKVPDHPGYYWLSQTWDNLFLSCKQCNQAHKGNRFDVMPQGPWLAMLRDKAGFAPNEKPMLLSPAQGVGVNPRHVLKFDPATAKAKPVQEGGATADDMSRAAMTIQIVGLNRPRLLEARAAHLVKLRSLFVLAASGGGWQRGAVDTPDILKFEYTNDDLPWKHAQTGLTEAIQPYSEFSALAFDAIVQWNTELKLQPLTLNVALQQPVQHVYVNTNVKLSLMPSITLHKKMRESAKSSVMSQSAPDTTVLDTDYNKTLAEYKQICDTIGEHEKKIRRAHEKVEALEAKLADLRGRRLVALRLKVPLNRMLDLDEQDDPIFDVEEELARQVKLATQISDKLQFAYRASLFFVGKHAQALEGVVNPNAIAQIKSMAQEATLRSQFDEAVKQSEMAKANHDALEKIRSDLRAISAQFDQQENKLSEAINDQDDYLNTFFAQLFGIISDATSWAEGYRNCGAPKDRVDRANELGTAAAAMYDFVETLIAVAPVEDHLNGKGFPPEIIRKK